MDYQAIRQRLDEELYSKVDTEISSSEREQYEGRLAEWEARYQAQRSIKGLMTTGVTDPEMIPLEDPFPGCADYGVPIEQSIIQELVPNVMSASLGMRPYTETTRIDERGAQPAGYVDDFLTYMMDRANIRSIRRKTLLTAYKFGEAVEKLIIEPKTRTVTEMRTYLTRGKGKGRKVLMGPNSEPLEVREGEDLLLLMLTQVQGEDPRSQFFRYCSRPESQGGLGLDEHAALEAAGIEVSKDGETWVRMAPLEQLGGEDQPPVANWDRAERYEVNDVEVTEEILINKWPQVVNVHPRDFLWPSGVETNNLMDFWIAHRYRVTLEWLLERVGDGHGEGFYADTVDHIVSLYKERKADEDKVDDRLPEVYEVYDRFVINNTDEDAEDYLRETEIVAWFCPEGGESKLLGWMTNPAARFKAEHIRPFFLYQVKPENNRFHGLSVPETCTGTRNMLDWLSNNELNYQAKYKFPPLLQSPNAFAHEQNQSEGLGERWILGAGETIQYLASPPSIRGGFDMHEMLIRTLRIMWGSNEQMSGHMTKTDSGTATEAQMLAQKGAQMFQDTVESISQIADQQYEYMKNFYLFSDIRDLQIPTGDRRQPDARAIAVTREMLEGPMVIRSRRVLTEQERVTKIQAYQMILQFLGNVQSPLLQNVKFMTQIGENLIDALNLEHLDVPTPEEMQEEAAAIQKRAQEMEVEQRYMKALEQEKNKGARDQIRSFLEQHGPGAVGGGMPGGGQPPPPGGGGMPGVGM